MSTSTFLVTVKLLLTLVVLVAQVSAPPPAQVPSQVLNESVCDKVIADFREDVERHNAIAFIRRENGQDVVDIDRERYTKRILMVVSSLKVGREGLRVQMVDEYVRKFHDLFVEFGLIPPLKDIKSSWHDIVKLYDEIYVGIITEAVLFKYIKYKIFLKNHQFREAIESFYDAKEPDILVRKNKLANYIVPFAREIFWTYDGGIDYITRQYQEHCLSPDGIVQQNKLHYLKLWWSSVSRFRRYREEDMTLWVEFMATACPLPEKEIQQFDSNETLLDLVDFEQEVAVPEQVKELRPYLQMISSKNSKMIKKLVKSFNTYKIFNKYFKKDHDKDLWIGYQKKLVVLQTIIRMMLKDPLITKISETSGEDNKLKESPTARKCFGSAMWKWTPMVCLAITGTIVYVGALAGLSYGTYYWLFGGSPDPTTPFPNITLLPPPPTGIPLPIEPVWLIVGVMVIVAIVLVGTVLCLVCRAKRKRNDGDKDKTSKTAKSKTKKEKNSRGSTVTKSAIKRSPVSSTPTCLLITTTGGTPSSTRPASSSLGHQRSSPYTTSAFTTSDINEAQGHRPVLSPKSPVAKPTFSFSTPRKALSKSPLFIGSSILWSSTPGPDIVNSSASSQLSSISSAFPGSNAQAPKVALPTKANSPPTNVKSPPGKAQTGKGNTTTTKPGDTKEAKKRDPKK